MPLEVTLWVYSSVDWASRTGPDLYPSDSCQYLAEGPQDMGSSRWNVEARDGLDGKGGITC